jgi:hypothetical protein
MANVFCQKEKLEIDMIFEVINCQKSGEKNSKKNCQILMFGFHCVAKNIEG